MTTPTPIPVQTDAERAFAALPDERKLLLLQRVFEVMEYDSDGNPGVDCSDAAQNICERFSWFGVVFTNPDEVEHCDYCDKVLLERDGVVLHRDGTPACPNDDERADQD